MKRATGTRATGLDHTDMATPIVLASRSPIRAEILANAGVAVTVRPAAVDEEAIRAEAVASRAALAPHELAIRLAEAKAKAGSAAHPGALAIGADQVLSLDGEVFSKPPTLEAAADQLRRLRATTHRLDSAFACVRDGKLLAGETDGAVLTMRAFSDEFLDAYIAQAGPGIIGCVGGYQLEGLGAQLFERIEGDYFTVLGLPLLPLLAALRSHGLLPS